MDQTVFNGAPLGIKSTPYVKASMNYTTSKGYCWQDPWDFEHARFRECFYGVLKSIPAILALVLLAYHILRLAIPWRPRWLRPFVEEHAEPGIEEYGKPKSTWSLSALLLVAMSALGLSLQLLLLAMLSFSIFPPIPWFVVLVLIVVLRPRTAPYASLTILIMQAIVQAILVSHHADISDPLNGGAEYGTLIAALIGIAVILCMPMRDPHIPSKEISAPSSEPTSSLRSPEDKLSLWQFMTVSWMTPLIRMGSKRQLQDEDVWSLGHEFQHRQLHDNFRQLKGTVVQRLLRANGIDLVILTWLGLIELLASYAVPLLLQRLLSSMEDLQAPRGAAITYAALSLAVRLITCQSGVFSLWFGRRCYERSRGEMITMLYEKTLGRKIAFKPEEEKKEATVSTDTNGSANGAIPELEIPSKKQPTLWQKSTRKLSTFFKRVKAVEPTKEPASMGKILNLMRNDVYEVAQRFWEFQSLVTKPLSCVFSIALVINFLGWSSLVAVAVLVVCQIVNAILARIMISYEKKRRAATDAKLSVITQFVEAIRHLRWYGWQDTWLEQIMAARQKELNLKIVTNCWNVAISFFNTLGLDLTPVVAFGAYTLITGKPLRVDIAFPAMQLFQMMTSALRDLPNLIIVIINAWVAVGRIEDFMAEADKEEMNTEALIGDSMAVEHGTFSWPGVAKNVLVDVSVSFPPGLTVIVGEVASGKTALLQALLGELDMHKGQLMRPQEPVGYCAQTPWLQSMSIRENILFSAPYDEARYRDVLDACALTPDLAEFKAGDLSFIGENGIGLSGGQRARVALARAIYSRNKIMLLDDPLSALDQQTAEAIVKKCFDGPLMEDRTTVLVTHRTDLVLSLAIQVVKMEHGTAKTLDHDAAQHDDLHRTVSSQSQHNTDEQAAEKQKAAAIPEKFIEDEHRAHGGVKAKVYWEYIKAGKIRWWIVLVLVLAAYRFFSVAQVWFLKTWGEAYNERSSVHLQAFHADTVISSSDFFKNLPHPEDNIRPWLIAFAALALSQSLLFVLSQSLMIVIVYIAARRMFRDVMTKVANATFRFYDVTPVGRLMNRMTSDIGVIDGNISQRFQGVAWLGISWISSVVVIGSVTPSFLVFAVVLTIAFVVIFMRFLPTSQSLRRLEMVSLTPLMSNFGALLNGLTTVRAFCAQSRFQDRVIEVVDTFQKMDHFYWSLQSWLMYRFDALSAISTFVLTVLALVTNVSPGLTAFVLVAANKFVISTHYLCRQYGALQMEFVSVERVVELLHLDQEPTGTVTPPAWWPSLSGDIVFDNVVIKYSPTDDPALRGVSFTIKGGSKTAIIGRTGSGKSTLALALLATILPESGSITIDNIDLAHVDKQLLRTRITFLAQDPVLFPGTLRSNLDPLNEHPDSSCSLVLSRVCSRQNWSIDTKIEPGGRNLSQGQRQLVGLARAVLRRSAIVILDEATASIDAETAAEIQRVMGEEMGGCTVVTVAHRLEAVRGADYCVVLGKGEVLEQGAAGEMLGRREG
ncbi:hypothetical protein LTR62_005697 [Meristemomyces frigidus]|uniref:ABC transporter n=1 Tax=Meristemomyces frigidus TaxID=1508187 RepID=A0AAN7TCK1_9PEZI|nr:hypothetical protein LTR62_005697 [Meristemomyces frigidus]